MESQNTSKNYKTPIYIRKNNDKYRAKNADKIKEHHDLKIQELKERGLYEAYKAERAAYMKKYRESKKLAKESNELSAEPIK
jgi:hypothetical protein